jgi:hypothetical protein
MLIRLRESCHNARGIKVSDTPWESFSRYLLDGFDVLVGPEAMIERGMGAGAVSGRTGSLAERGAG